MRAGRGLATALVGVHLGLILACGGAARERSSWHDPEPGIFETGPYAVVDGTSGALLAMKADVPGRPTLAWRNVAVDDQPPGELREAAFSRVDDLWVARVPGEEASHRISYQVRTELGVSEEHELQMGRPEGASFRFAVFGDTGTNHGVHRSVIEALVAEELDFVVHTGDMVDDGGAESSWDRFFQIERPLLRTVPIVPSMGNHDSGARHHYRRYFLQEQRTGGRRYVSLDWGNLRLVGLDINTEGDGSDQLAFAERALAEGAERGMLMVIFLHHPPYSSGRSGSNRSARDVVVPLAKRYGVELVIAGHDRSYERTVPLDGTVYVVSGSAGSPTRSVRPQPFTAHARTDPHYVLVDVDGDSMIVRAVDLRGDTFDTHVIASVPPAP